MPEIKTKKVEPMLPSYMVDIPVGAPQPELPEIHLDLRAIDGSDEWQVGDRYRIVLVGTLCGMHNDEGDGSFEMEVEEAGGALEETPSRVSRVAAKGE